MLVVRPDRLHEGHCGQPARIHVGEEILLVLEMFGAGRRAVPELTKVREGLVMELEEPVRLPGQRVLPAPRVPGPAHARLAQPVPDGGQGLRRHAALERDIGRIRLIRAEGRVDHEAVGRDLPVLDEHPVGVELGPDLRGRLPPHRRAGAHEPEMIEEGAAEGRVVETVEQREFSGQRPGGELGAVVVAHDQSCRVAPGHELVHPPAVDLVLLLVETVHEVARLLARRHEPVDQERRVGQVGREAQIRRGRAPGGVDGLRQRAVDATVPVHLRGRRA